MPGPCSNAVLAATDPAIWESAFQIRDASIGDIRVHEKNAFELIEGMKHVERFVGNGSDPT